MLMWNSLVLQPSISTIILSSAGMRQASDADLSFPTRVPDRKGNATVQIQRTIHSGRYANGHAHPGVWSSALRGENAQISMLMLVDGEWGTVGSCNLHRYSLFGNSELNVAFWDQETSRALLSELLQEHLDLHTADLDDLAALQLIRKIARNNRGLFEKDDNRWQGLAFSLFPTAKA